MKIIKLDLAFAIVALSGIPIFISALNYPSAVKWTGNAQVVRAMRNKQQQITLKMQSQSGAVKFSVTDTEVVDAWLDDQRKTFICTVRDNGAAECSSLPKK